MLSRRRQLLQQFKLLADILLLGRYRLYVRMFQIHHIVAGVAHFFDNTFVRVNFQFQGLREYDGNDGVRQAFTVGLTV